MTDAAEIPIVAVPVSVLSAAFFGLAGALQHRAARRTSQTGTVRFRMIIELLRQPLWVGSLLAGGLGVLLQWVALSTGTLILVQPLLVIGLLFAVVFSSALRRARPDRVVVLGTVMCAAGLATFLALASPTPGHDSLVFHEVVPLASALAGVLVLCVAVGVRRPGPVRALALATATGVLYGVTAGLTKLAVAGLRDGLGVMFSEWPIYFVVLCGPIGFLLNQNAFRVGAALAPALAVIVVLDPLVSIGIGALWLGEQVVQTPGALAGESIALAVLIAGVAVLSKRAPQAAQAAEQRERLPGHSPERAG